ncbi:MAG: polysaccharide deacetylase family protein [Candidatus Marinimicrobia bacterium]|nr:polysaccharide deacetylase family protein [Candidatus Neomarinimicrobiota bacterium]
MGFSSDVEYKILFDDGYASVYDIAFPLMQKYDFTGLIFPVVNYIGKMNDWDVTFASFNTAKHVDVNQISVLANNGWEIGSHGLSHSAFTSMCDDQLKIELQQSKEILEDIVQQEVISITPPFSRWNQRVKDLILECGYKKIYYQRTLKKEPCPIMIPRHSVYSIDGEKAIIRKVNNSRIEQIKEAIIHKCSTLTVVVKEIL